MKCSERVVRDFVLICWTKFFPSNPSSKGKRNKKFGESETQLTFFIPHFLVCVQTNLIFFTCAFETFSGENGEGKSGCCQVIALFVLRWGQKVSNLIATAPKSKNYFMEHVRKIIFLLFLEKSF